MLGYNKAYFAECVENKDLMIMGMYDPKQDYAIFHKWGNKNDVTNLLKVWKKTSKKSGLSEDVFVTYQYPEFTLDEFQDFLDRTEAFKEFHKRKING
jgi:hypothetical protein